MASDVVEPGTTLAVILGAREWPLSPNLRGSEAFSKSADGLLKYLRAEDGFKLPADNLLDLFDTQKAPSEIDEEISKFLTNRQKELSEAGSTATDILIYYVGHGGFTPGKQEYFLATRTTRSDREGASSVRVSDLARTVKTDAAGLRRFLVFDCCFAAQAYQEFQSPGPAEAARVKTLGEFPRKGTAMLCASSAQDVALAPRGDEYTMFSGALLQVLRTGDPTVKGSLTLEQLGERVRAAIKERYPDEAVRPEVKSPDEREGDVARIPLFPNPALRPQQLEDRLGRMERTVDALLRKLSDVDKSVGLITSVQRKIAEAEPQPGRVDEQDVRELESAHDESRQKEWLRDTLPGEVQLFLRLYGQARWIGLGWLLFSIVLCLPQMYSILVHPVPILGGASRTNPWYWLVILLAYYSMWVMGRPIWRAVWLRRRPVEGRPDYEPWFDLSSGPWDTLPEVVAMRSTRAPRALGSLRIASPFFEIGAGISILTAVLSILRLLIPVTRDLLTK